jgi:hypothetical protein
MSSTHIELQKPHAPAGLLAVLSRGPDGVASSRRDAAGGWPGPECPVSPNLARQHAADLRRTRFAETASSWSSH